MRGGELADRVFAREVAELDERERAWTRELVFGTFRLRGRLDHWLGALVHSGLDSLHPDVLDTLRLGAYQLREMGGVPAYAAVSESVELARWAGQSRAAGLVNGVLRALRRGGYRVDFPDFASDPAGHLSTWGSHPRWLVQRWLGRWGADSVRRLTEADNRVPDLFLHPLGVSPAAAAARLAEVGIASETVSWAPDSLRLAESSTLRTALVHVAAVVQDPAAAWVVRYAAVPPGARVLDLCAAPGGKAFVAAQRAGMVVAADRSLGRLQRVREGVERLGVAERISLVVADARHPPFRSADLVLLDAPCTGTGTLRRHPDGRWRIREADLAALATLQAEMLAAAAPRVRPEGWLVYSTCSLEPEENELQVARFITDHPGWTIDPPADLPSALRGDGGTLRVLPQDWGADGAFAARLRRPA